VGLEFQSNKGQTPIDEEEKEDLLLRTISTRGELDDFERRNIDQAIKWSLNNSFSSDEILSIAFINELHRRMFSVVWDWAGTFRRSNKNIGVDKFIIEQELLKLTEDCRYWIANKVYPEDEIAVRYKFRMVSIHPFPNGNGRHSRICGDILVSHVLSRPVFPWGGKRIEEVGETRRKYLQALYEADQGDVGALLEFARSGVLAEPVK
jgi:Fic-DOC domain mobile mystery protein B